MTTPLLSFDDNGVQHAWDGTSLGNYEKCPRYYQLVNLLGYQPELKSPHLLFGGWYATALEHYFKHLSNGMDPEAATLEVVHETLIATWTHDIDPEDGVSPIPDTGYPWESLHAGKTRETLIRSIVWYLDHFANDNMPLLHLSDGTPAVEYSFALPLDDDITYCGHMDRVVEYSNGNYIMDQKTSGATITSRFFENFTPDIQMSGYTYAGQIIFGIPIAGVIIDAAQIAVGFTRFERGFIHRTQSQLNEWYESSMATIANARKATEENFFPMNRQSCGNYGGCSMRDVCAASPTHRKRLLEANFRVAPRWDPMTRR